MFRITAVKQRKNEKSNKYRKQTISSSLQIIIPAPEKHQIT